MKKINVNKEFGIKKNIEVKESNKNMRKVYSMQLQMSKLGKLVDDASDDELLLSSMIDLIDDSQEFIMDILKLDDKYLVKVEDLSQNETFELVNKITEELTGADMEKTDDGKEDPKSE